MTLLLVGASILISCQKDKELSTTDNIVGTWISTDKSDTLDFMDKSSFYKSNIDFRHELFNYILEKDSVEIEYNGLRMVTN